MTAPLSLSGLDLRRRNGELAFDAPWQSTVFALAAAVTEHAFGGDREPFRHRRLPRPGVPDEHAQQFPGRQVRREVELSAGGDLIAKQLGLLVRVARATSRTGLLVP